MVCYKVRYKVYPNPKGRRNVMRDVNLTLRDVIRSTRDVRDVGDLRDVKVLFAGPL